MHLAISQGSISPTYSEISLSSTATSPDLVQSMDSPQSSMDGRSDISDLVAAEVARQMVILQQGKTVPQTHAVDADASDITAGADELDNPEIPLNALWSYRDEPVEIIAGGQLFRGVPRLSLQRGSPRFRELVEQATDADGHVSPIGMVDAISAIDFERFLEVLYPVIVGAYSLDCADEWMSALRVSHYLSFESMKVLAIDRLEAKASPVEKIVCAREFGVDAWLEGAYTDLCYRQASLTGEEISLLGADTTAKIMAAREAVRPNVDVTYQTARRAVQGIFWPVLAPTPRAASPSTPLSANGSFGATKQHCPWEGGVAAPLPRGLSPQSTVLAPRTPSPYLSFPARGSPPKASPYFPAKPEPLPSSMCSPLSVGYAKVLPEPEPADFCSYQYQKAPPPEPEPLDLSSYTQSKKGKKGKPLSILCETELAPGPAKGKKGKKVPVPYDTEAPQ